MTELTHIEFYPTLLANRIDCEAIAQICRLVEIKANATPMTAAEIANFALSLSEVYQTPPLGAIQQALTSIGNEPGSGTQEITAATETPGENETGAVEWLGLRAPGDPFCPPEESIVENGNFLICLESGKKLKMLRRHLNEMYGMTFEYYCEKWGLPKGYPAAAPKYSEQKAKAARNQKFGQYDRATKGKKKARGTVITWPQAA